MSNNEPALTRGALTTTGHLRRWIVWKALAEAAPGREVSWRNEVFQALSVLEAAAAEEADNARRPDSLLSDLAHKQPRLRNRARALRLQYEKVRETIALLRQELEGREHAGVDFADVRQRTGWVLTSLRHHELENLTSSTRPTTTRSTLNCVRPVGKLRRGSVVPRMGVREVAGKGIFPAQGSCVAAPRSL